MCLIHAFCSSLLFPSRGRRTRTFSSESKIGQADFTNWIPFVSFILMEEISPNPEALIANTQTLSSAWNSWKDIRKCVYRAVYRAVAPALTAFLNVLFWQVTHYCNFCITISRCFHFVYITSFCPRAVRNFVLEKCFALTYDLSFMVPSILSYFIISHLKFCSPLCSSFKLFHDGGSYHIKTSPLICIASYCTGFYLIGTSITKELKYFMLSLDCIEEQKLHNIF